MGSGPFSHRCPALDNSKPVPVGQSPGTSPVPLRGSWIFTSQAPKSLSAHLVLGFALKYSCLTWRLRARLRDRPEQICMSPGAERATICHCGHQGQEVRWEAEKLEAEGASRRVVGQLGRLRKPVPVLPCPPTCLKSFTLNVFKRKRLC